MFTPQQVALYHTRGYLSVEGVISKREIDELRRVTGAFVEKSRCVIENDDVFDLEPGHSSRTPRLRRLKSPPKQHPAYDRMLRHNTILDIVAQLIGPGIRTTGQKLNMKSPETGSPVEWHQDWAFVPQTNDDLLTVGLALDDMTRKNGCLLVIPGSHAGRIYDHHQDGAFVGAVTEPSFTPEGAVPVELRAGGISIHHFRLLHGSTPNTSSRPRRLLLLEYAAVDAWPLLGADWETFKTSILRGEPSCEPRLASVPVRMPLPPAKRQGSIYETQSTLKRPLYSGRPDPQVL